MKKLFTICSLLLATTITQAQVKMPQPSPAQTVKQDFGLTSVEVKYSRPLAKGRKIMGDLVPFGQVWRTGANAATLITFNDKVEIDGKKIDSGTYALYSIPNKNNWVIILNKGVKNWGSDGYTADDDVVRFTVKAEETKNMVESFTIQFADVKPESCDLQILWENTMVSFPIKTDVKSTIKKTLESALQNSEKKPYWQAMQFYNEWENNPTKALQYAELAVQDNPKAFYMWLYKARLEKATGNKVKAMESSKKSLELAKEAKNNDYVKMNEELQKSLK